MMSDRNNYWDVDANHCLQESDRRIVTGLSFPHVSNSMMTTMSLIKIYSICYRE